MFGMLSGALSRSILGAAMLRKVPGEKFATRYIDLTGQRYGRLTVTEQSRPSDKPNGSQGRQWHCRCDCGTEVWVPAGMLRRNAAIKNPGTKSCGCLARENGRKYLAQFGVPAPLRKAPGQSARRALFRRYARTATRRGFEWALQWEQFCALIASPCTYCGGGPSQTLTEPHRNGGFTYTGLDRVNNKAGYAPDNTAPCCGTCNYMKRALPVEEFLAHVARITQHAEMRRDAPH
jgi:hypothetical protein